jgi:hypothetical protein
VLSLRGTVAAWVLALVAPLLSLVACGGPPCRSQSDCARGQHCVLDVGGPGAPSGECRAECAVAADCSTPDDQLFLPLCTDQGRCRVVPRPPTLRVLEPAPGAAFAEGTRAVRVAGEVETAAAEVRITASASNARGCGGGVERTVIASNPTPGRYVALPFVIDALPVDPGSASLVVNAAVESSRQREERRIEILCPDCPALAFVSPTPLLAVAGLELDRLEGLGGADVDGLGAWRVHSLAGEVFDGPLTFGAGGRFLAERLPLFTGLNRLEVVARARGGGEGRCSVMLGAGQARERGLRALLTWDAATVDLDLHLIGPGGRFGDPATSLSARGPRPRFGGEVRDDFAGFGPETLRLDPIPDGVWGLVVEPVFDGEEGGASARVRVLFDGRVLGAPVGPVFVSADRGDLWVVGVLAVQGGLAEWRPLSELLLANLPPTTPPEVWPLFR